MSTQQVKIESIEQDSSLSNAPAPATIATPATQPEVSETVPLAVALRSIARDARVDPQRYLDETIVPFGGE